MTTKLLSYLNPVALCVTDPRNKHVLAYSETDFGECPTATAEQLLFPNIFKNRSFGKEPKNTPYLLAKKKTAKKKSGPRGRLESSVERAEREREFS